MKRTVALTSVIVMILTVCLWTYDAWARAGGGKSAGSRGSRSSSSPADPALSPSSSPRQTAPAAQQSVPQRSWMSGLMGGMMGFAIGGVIGSLLFGGLGGGLFGGVGLLEILLIGGLVYFIFSYIRRRQQPALATPSGYAPAQGMEAPSSPSESRPMPMATLEAPGTENDLARGLRHIRQIDHTFTPERFVEAASSVFCKVQAAWSTRDVSTIGDLLTPEMVETLQQECDRLRQQRRLNRIENVAVHSVQVTEAWQEIGQDFVTVHILANLLDYTVDESSRQVLMGSRTEPIQFAEYWTFVRPVGPNAWKLSAIQQAR